MSNSSQSIRERRVQRALRFIASTGTHQKVLDIGCQSGGFCGELLKLGHEPHGIEIMAELVQNARRNQPNIDFIVGDCSKEIPYPDASFDVVWAGEVIEHIGYTDVFVNEVNRVLRIGGHFILTTPMHNRLKNIYLVLFKFEQHFDPEFPHYRFYTKKSLCDVLTKRGFEIADIDYTGRIPLLANTIFVAAKKLATKKVMSTYHS